MWLASGMLEILVIHCVHSMKGMMAVAQEKPDCSLESNVQNSNDNDKFNLAIEAVEV